MIAAPGSIHFIYYDETTYYHGVVASYLFNATSLNPRTVMIFLDLDTSTLLELDLDKIDIVDEPTYRTGRGR